MTTSKKHAVLGALLISLAAVYMILWFFSREWAQDVGIVYAAIMATGSWISVRWEKERKRKWPSS